MKKIVILLLIFLTLAIGYVVMSKKDPLGSYKIGYTQRQKKEPAHYMQAPNNNLMFL